MIQINETAILYNGDMLEILDTLPENSIDTCITDPPYHLTSIVKRFGKKGSAPAQYGTDGVFARASAGFMGKEWDGGDIAFRPETWAKVYRVLKPGAYCLAFGGDRTYHRLACAVEDAGFILFGCIVWAHGQGFPKAYNVGKGVNAKLSIGTAQPQALRKARMGDNYEPTGQEDYRKGRMFESLPNDDYEEVFSEEAMFWKGYRTALKPAIELITIAMKPLDGTYVENALKWGVAGFNIDGARVPTEEAVPINKLEQWSGFGQKERPDYKQETNTEGRYPANLIHDGSDEVVGLFPQSSGGAFPKKSNVPSGAHYEGGWGKVDNEKRIEMGDGSAARFFYCAKPSKAERNEGLEDMDERLFGQSGGAQGVLSKGGEEYKQNSIGLNRIKKVKNHHPTVKPLSLLEHLVTLTKTPTGGTVLDPFMGSGTTGCACALQGRKFIGVELEEEYFEIARRRIEYYVNLPKQGSLL